MNINKGGAAYLDVIVHNRDGFKSTVTITAEGLPPGLHFTPSVVNSTHGVFVLWADKHAANFAGPIKLTATAKRGDETITREVRPYTRVWNTADPASSRPSSDLFVSIIDIAPFAVSPTVAKIEGEPGKKVDLVLKVDRLWPDFKGNVTVIPLSIPNGVKVGTVTIPEGKTEATVSLELPTNQKAEEYTLVFTAQGQVPFVKDAKDPKATARPTTLVPVPTRPVTLVVREAAKAK
jgi:hypothetical protein